MDRKQEKMFSFRCWRKTPNGENLYSGRDRLKPNPRARLWSEVGFKPESTEVKAEKKTAQPT